MIKKKDIAFTAIKKMFRDRPFNILIFKDCAELLNIIIEPTMYKNLSILHCVRFEDMSDGLKSYVFDCIINTFFKEEKESEDEFLNKLINI